MPALREALAESGFGEARTYLQSGNILLDGDQAPDGLAASVARLLSERFGLEVRVLARTVEELVQVVARNPFPREAASNPKLLQVTFRDEAVQPDALTGLSARAAPREKVAASGREIYSWHPDGIARSKLALALTPGGGAATARNWTTVTTLLGMATDGD